MHRVIDYHPESQSFRMHIRSIYGTSCGPSRLRINVSFPQANVGPIRRRKRVGKLGMVHKTSNYSPNQKEITFCTFLHIFFVRPKNNNFSTLDNYSLGMSRGENTPISVHGSQKNVFHSKKSKLSIW